MEDLEESKKVLVYQSNKLIEASYRLRIGQQKFLRLMASMIKKNDEDFKEYEFRISDVMELFDTNSKKSYTELIKQLKELMGNVLTFKYGKTTTLVPFLAFARQDEGSGIIKVMFHPFLKPMYLHLNKENPFTIYELSNTLKLRSTYAIRIYELLKQYQKIGYRELRIDDMRLMFDVQPTEYTRYNDFKRKVIIQAQKELKEKTDISFEFEEIKTGRKFTSLKFYIKHNQVQKEISATKMDAELKAPQGEKISEDEASGVKRVKAIMSEHDISDIEALKILKSSKGDFTVIQRVYNHFKNKQSDNFVALIISMVKPNAFQEPKINIKQDNFNNFEQRTYDYNALEKKLLGFNDTNSIESLDENVGN